MKKDKKFSCCIFFLQFLAIKSLELDWIRNRIRIKTHLKCGILICIRIQWTRIHTDFFLCFESVLIWSGSSIPNRIRIKKIYSWKKLYNFLINLPIPMPCLHEGRPSYRRTLQFNSIQQFRTWNFLFFYIFVDYFCPPELGSTDLIESRGNPDPKHWIF